jgi:acyl carrier protein
VANDKVKREVVEIVADIADLDPGQVSPEATFEELGIDSLGGLRLVAEVERRYGIVIDEAEIPKIRSMPDVLDTIDRLAGSAR